MAHPFKVTDEFEVTATPEEVWDASGGPGRRRRLVHGRERDRAVGGGATRMQFRGSAEEATATA